MPFYTKDVSIEDAFAMSDGRIFLVCEHFEHTKRISKCSALLKKGKVVIGTIEIDNEEMPLKRASAKKRRVLATKSKIDVEQVKGGSFVLHFI